MALTVKTTRESKEMHVSSLTTKKYFLIISCIDNVITSYMFKC